jgi:hypothetical protein
VLLGQARIVLEQSRERADLLKEVIDRVTALEKNLEELGGHL